MAKKKNKSEISPMDLVKISKRKQREEMIAQGAQTLRATRTHKSKKDYNRNPKHKGRVDYWKYFRFVSESGREKSLPFSVFSPQSTI